MLKKFEACAMVAFIVLVLVMASSVAWAHPGGKLSVGPVSDVP